MEWAHLAALLTHAEASGVASALLPGATPSLAAAAASDVRTAQGIAAVVLLVHPLLAEQLAPLALQEQVSLRLGDLERGAEGDLATLRGLTTGSLGPCCATRELQPGLALSVFKAPDAVLAAAEQDLASLRLLALGVASLLSLVVLAFGFWPRPPEAGQERLLQQTSEALLRSQAELARLSQVVTRTGTHVAAAGAGPVDEGLLDTRQTSSPSSRYHVLDLLGEGGMARVYVAALEGAEGFRRLVVVKRLKAELAASQEAVNQFVDEARLGASLTHANIIPVLDFGRDTGGYFLAQEYLVGRTIDALVQASLAQRGGRALEPGVVLYLAQEALKALGYAHALADEQGHPLGLVHRDVSPNNLMVTTQGEVKLLDFGIVKSEQRLTHTQTGMVKGNLFFMSPEQARALAVDGRSDLYALALVLFTAATGQMLWSGQSAYELLTRAGAGLTPEDVQRVEQLPAPLPELLLGALATDPAARYPSAAEFSRALAGHPVASAAEVAGLVEQLLGVELAMEKARFSGKVT